MPSDHSGKVPTVLAPWDFDTGDVHPSLSVPYRMSMVYLRPIFYVQWLLVDRSNIFVALNYSFFSSRASISITIVSANFLSSQSSRRRVCGWQIYSIHCDGQ